MSQEANYVGQLFELVRKVVGPTAEPAFRILETSDGLGKGKGIFTVEVTADGQTATGSATQKKQARRVAAKELLDKLLDDPKVNAKGGRIVTENTVELEKVKVDNKDLWTKCIKLLPTDDEDYVKQLKIFSLNSATGLPRYKYEAAKAAGGAAVEVTCLWNQFFLPGRGDTRSTGEQAAAMAMLNKVREVCGLPAMAPREVARKAWVPKALVSAPGEAVTADVVAVYKAVMGRGRAAVEPRSSLEELADRLGCDGPEFAISGVENTGLEVTVVVRCCWRGMEVEGRAASKRLAEAAAARAVLAELGELVARGPEQAADTSQDSVDVTYASMEARAGGEVEGRVKEEEEGESEDTRYCCFPLGGTAAITVTRKDYECLREEQFLNDVIIDFYLKFLQHGLFVSDPSVQERTHIFSIYFYERLITKPKTKLSVNAPPMSPEERRYNNVKKWTKNINIFEKDFVIVPINHEEHWYVVVVCYPGLLRPRRVGDRVECPVILLLDSLEDGMKDEVVGHLREYLACEWREKMVLAGSAEVRLFQASAMPHFCPDIPQQPNLTDCGLYLLEYVEAFFRRPITDYTVPLASLADWFTAEAVRGKRAAIAGIIRGLAADQHSDTTFAFPNLTLPLPQDGLDNSDLNTQQKIKLNLLPTAGERPGWAAQVTKRHQGEGSEETEGPKKARVES